VDEYKEHLYVRKLIKYIENRLEYLYTCLFYSGLN